MATEGVPGSATWVDEQVVVLFEAQRYYLGNAVEGAGQVVEGLARQVDVAPRLHTHTARTQAHAADISEALLRGGRPHSGRDVQQPTASQSSVDHRGMVWWIEQFGLPVDVVSGAAAVGFEPVARPE